MPLRALPPKVPTFGRIRAIWHRRLSFRSSLAAAVPLLILLTTGVVVYRAARSATHEVSILAEAQFAEAARNAIARTEGELHSAVATLQELAGMAQLGALPDDETLLAKQFLAVLRAHPSFTWVSYGGENGRFVGAWRDRTSLYLNFSSPKADGKVQLREYRVQPDEQWVLHRQSEDHGYDPRTRPFYQQAVSAKGTIWTQPYVFFEDGATPGITSATPRYGPDGKLQGVLTVDFNLLGLSRLLAGVQLGSSGVLALTTDKGDLLAHPTAPVVGKEGTGLLPATQSSDPVVRAVAKLQGQPLRHHLSAAVSRGPTLAQVTEVEAQEEVEIGGEPWLIRRVQAELTSTLVLNVWAAAPAREFLAGVQKNAQENLLVTVLALALGVGIALAFASFLSRPLAELAGQMRRVGQFQLAEPPTQGSVFVELDTMAESLEAMKGGLRSFASFVPGDLVRRLMHESGELGVAGELRELTLFFSDIEGFTALSETVPPDELVERLSRYLAVVTSILAEYHGTVDKFLGDGVMAFWNAPEDVPEHQVAAVRAALHLQHKLAELAAANDPAALPTRIGLSSGEVVVGTIGTAERLNYTALGDRVNLAARLEALNKQYETRILCSDAVAEAAADAVIMRPIDVAAVRGKKVPQRIYEPMCERGDPTAGRAAAIARLCTAALNARLAGEPEQAAARYAEALRLDPDDAVLKRLLAVCEQEAAAVPLAQTLPSAAEAGAV